MVLTWQTTPIGDHGSYLCIFLSKILYGGWRGDRGPEASCPHGRIFLSKVSVKWTSPVRKPMLSHIQWKTYSHTTAALSCSVRLGECPKSSSHHGPYFDCQASPHALLRMQQVGSRCNYPEIGELSKVFDIEEWLPYHVTMDTVLAWNHGSLDHPR